MQTLVPMFRSHSLHLPRAGVSVSGCALRWLEENSQARWSGQAGELESLPCNFLAGG